MTYEFCCPTLFGLEGIVGDELRYGGKLEDVRVENGRVFFSGDEQTLIWANLWLRSAERVLITIGSFEAHTFEELFDGVYELPWLDYIEKDYAFPVKGYSLSSDLHSVPDCQSIVKKAIVKSLSEAYGIEWFEETGPRCQIQFAIMNNQVTLYLDTSGAGLHKRGYRANAN
ncbi:MAG: THUMP domain-containing protein, partial [Eubacteriales bacterium]|nr:THUMP domain-containing protein [Eubacteriales bacterium]